MKYKLDHKELCAFRSNQLEWFYRYHIVDDADNVLATVWFSQTQDKKHIYSVMCNLNSPKLVDFDLYFDIPLNGPYRPSHYYMRLKETRVDDGNYYEIHNGMEMVRNIACCAMTIFGNTEHITLEEENV